MMRNIALFGLAWVTVLSTNWCVGQPIVAARSPEFEIVDEYVASQMRELGIPGAALVIVEGDQIVHLRAFGVADADGRPVTEQTPFFTGSTGKSVTALAILQLVEAGKIRLDAPVQTYLPWFRVADGEASSRITIRQLLTMTSGLSTKTGREPLNNPNPADTAIEDNVRALARAELIGPPGERFEYSNANYITLGMIIQAVTGESYEAYVQDHVFKPLTMRHSFTSKAEAQSEGLAVGYQKWFGVPVAAPDLPFSRGSLPAGELMMSAEDFGHYLIAHLNAGSYCGVAIASPAGIAELHRPAAQMSGMGHTYAMGWEVQAYQNIQVISHDGAVPGFTTGMFLVPGKDMAVAVMLNTQSPMLGNRVAGVPGNVLRLVMGQTIVPLAENPAMQIVYAFVMLTPLLQVVAVAKSIRRLRGWRARSERPTRNQIAWHIGWSVTLNAALAFTLLIGLPMASSADLATIVLFQPDVGWVAATGGASAIIWAMSSIVVGLSMWRHPAE